MRGILEQENINYVRP